VWTHSIGSPEECYWSGTREDYRGALRDIHGYSPFTQAPMKVVEVLLQVADKQRRLAGRGYDGRVARVVGQLDVVRGWRHAVGIHTEADREGQSTLSYPSPQASTRRRGRLEGVTRATFGS